MRAIGVKPNSLALEAFITMTAAAPSLIPEALPAVTLPSFLKAGFNLPKDAAVVPARGNSSVLNTKGSPLR